MGRISLPSMLIIFVYRVKTDILQNNTQALLVNSREIGLRVNAEKPSPCFISNMQEENKM